ncbi:MAG: hypothetical protein Q7T82_08010 [Armatimonadota bacterium]|nr:hypothetical protein [Armatimonadota bacterium]
MHRGPWLHQYGLAGQTECEAGDRIGCGGQGRRLLRLGGDRDVHQRVDRPLPGETSRHEIQTTTARVRFHSEFPPGGSVCVFAPGTPPTACENYVVASGILTYSSVAQIFVVRWGQCTETLATTLNLPSAPLQGSRGLTVYTGADPQTYYGEAGAAFDTWATIACPQNPNADGTILGGWNTQWFNAPYGMFANKNQGQTIDDMAERKSRRESRNRGRLPSSGDMPFPPITMRFRRRQSADSLRAGWFRWGRLCAVRRLLAAEQAVEVGFSESAVDRRLGLNPGGEGGTHVRSCTTRRNCRAGV